MDRSVPRIGAWAGFIAVIGIMGYHIALMLIGGTRVSGTTDAAAINAYYANGGIANVSVLGFLILIPFLVFVVALREVTGQTSMGRLLGTIALAAAAIELAVLLVMVSAQAAIVTAVSSGSDAVPLFRFWDVLYNSGTYAFEATWVAAFGLAMRETGLFPRWMVGLSAITAVLLVINVVAIWVGIPDQATLPSALALAAWFVGASLGLRRMASEPRQLVEPLPA
jgi:hypothetical protein